MKGINTFGDKKKFYKEKKMWKNEARLLRGYAGGD